VFFNVCYLPPDGSDTNWFRTLAPICVLLVLNLYTPLTKTQLFNISMAPRLSGARVPWKLPRCGQDYSRLNATIEVFLRSGTMLDSGMLVNNGSKFVIKNLRFLRMWFEIIARYGPCLRVPWTTEDRNAPECCIKCHFLLSSPSQRIKSASVTRTGQRRLLRGIICFDFESRTKLKTAVLG